MAWKPPKKGTSNKNTDRIQSGKEKPRSRRSGASNNKNTKGVGIPRTTKDRSMTNNIRQSSNKQPRTIKEAQQKRAELYHARVKINQEKRAAQKKRAELERQARKVRKERARIEAALNAQKLLGNDTVVEALQERFEKASNIIQKLGAQRSGLTRTINNREKLAEQAETLRGNLLDAIEDIRNKRSGKSNTGKRTPTKDSAPISTAGEQQELDIEVPIAQQHPFPSDTHLKGGIILRDDTQVSPHVRIDAGVPHTSNAYIAAGIAFPQVIEHAPPTTGHETQFQQNLADVISKADKAGLTYEHEGVEMSIAEAIMSHASPHEVWDHIKNNFDGGSAIEKIPYKGIVDLA